MNFGIILGGFWHHFGSQNALKNRMKFWMRFFDEKTSRDHSKRVGPAECAGALGRIMEGYENQFRQRIEAEDRRQGPGVPALRLARRPRWGGREPRTNFQHCV